jgi:hypothetical protein
MIVVTRTSDISDEISSKLVAALPPSTAVENDRVLVLRSADAPSWIQLIGSVADWKTCLGAAADGFCEAIGGVAALYLVKNAPKCAAALRSAALKSLYDASVAIAAVHEQLGPRAVRVGLPIPNAHFSTTFAFYGESADDIAVQLVQFVNAAEIVESTLREYEKSDKILGGVRASFEPGGVVKLQWMTRREFKVVDIQLKLDSMAALNHPDDGDAPGDVAEPSAISVDFDK